MKRLAWLAMACVAVTSVQAEIRIFVTASSDGYGLSNPANAFQPTFSTVNEDGENVNGYDYADADGNPTGNFAVSSFPPANAPLGTEAEPILIQPGHWAYVWIQFQGEPKGLKVNGMHVGVSVAGSTDLAPVSTAWYVCNNMNSPILSKRWDGTATPPEYPEWHGNMQTFVAVTAYGLQNFGSDVPWNLYEGSSRIALLGAVQAPADGTVYQLRKSEICYFVPPGDYEFSLGYFKFVPEPATWFVLALGVLIVRRR